MPGTVDSLDIKISAEATAANTALSNLTTKLNTLSSALNKVNTSGIKSFSSSMTNLTTAMQGMKSVNASQFTKVANGISKLTAIDTSKLATVTNVMKPLAQAITSLNSVAFNSNGINSFINALTRLSGANLSGLNSTNFTQLGNSLKTLINSLAGASDVSTRTVQITNALAKLGAAGGTIGQVATELPTLGVALRSFISSLSGAETVNAEIISLTTSIASLASAGSKVATTASNLGLLATALKELFTTLASAPAVDSSIISMTNSLANLAAQGSSVGAASKSIASGFNVYSTSAATATKRTTSLATAFGKLFSAVFIIKSVFKGISESIELSSDLTEVQNVVDVAFGEYKDAIEEFSETSIENFGINELTAKTIASRYQAMSNAIGLTTDAAAEANTYLSDLTDGYVEAGGSVADMSVNLTKLAADMGSFYNVDADEVAEDLESVFTGTTKPLRQYGLDLTQATLQEWALKNGLDADISSMTQAEKVMLRYQYVLANTSDAQGDFSRTSDTWANRVRVLKLQFQSLATTIGSSLINAFKPALRALNNFMTKVITFVENIANALGKIFGWTIETTNVGSLTDDLADETTDATGDIADGYGDATDAAKEYENTVLSIDELHKLNDTNDDSGSGSGSSGDSGSGSSSGSGYSSTIKQTESLIDYYKSSLNSLYELGEYIGTTLTNALNSIDWNSVYQSARNFGTGLAEFLNGLISPELFYAVGRTIANALNTAIYASLSFATTLDWTDLGLSIAAGINGFFQNFDFTSLAASINAWVQGIFTMIKTAIRNISWKDVWKGITDFLGELDVSTVSIIIGAVLIKKILSMKLASGALTAVVKGLGSGIAAQLAGSIGAYLGVELTGKSMTQILSGAGTSVATTFIAGVKASFGSKAAGAALGFTNPFTLAVTGGASIAAGGFLSAFAIKGMWDKGYNAGDEVKLGIGAALAGVGAVILAPFTGGASIALFTGIAAGIFGGGNLAILIKNNLDEIVQFFKDLPGNIVKAIKGLPEKIGEIIDAVLQWFSELPAKIGYALGYAVGTIVSWVKDMVKKVKEKVPEIIDNVITFFTELPGKVWEWLTEVPGKIADWASDMIETVKEKVPEIIESIKEFFQELPEDFIQFGKDIIDGLWEGITSIWETIKQKWQEFKENFVQGFKDALGIASPSTVFAELGQYCIEGLINGLLSIPDKIAEAWETVKGWFSDIVVEAKAQIKQKWSDLKDKWHDITDNIKDKTATFKGSITQTWSNLKTKWTNITDNIKDKTATFKGQITQKWSDLKTKWTNISDNIQDKTAEFKATIKQKWSDLKSSWSNISDNVTDKNSTITAKIGTKWSDLKGTWESLLGHVEDEDVDVKVGLVKSGWKTIAKWIGTVDAIDQKIKLEKSGWKTVKAWVGTISTLSQPIKLAKSGWSTVKSWIGTISVLSQAIQLTKSGWSTVKGWIGSIQTLQQAISLAKSGWTSVKSWIGTIPSASVAVSLVKSGWTSLQSFIGNASKTIKCTIEWNYNLTSAQKKAAKQVYGINALPNFKFAAGGFLGNLSSADLLVTRENGIPEMIGRIGSQTAVANNDQIAAGIAAAVQPAVYNAMMAASASRGGNGNVELVLEIDGEEIGRVATNYQKLQNKRYTVEPSFV